MATVSSGIGMDANLMNLKAIKASEVRSEVPSLLLPGESVVSAFQTVRDQVIFTDKRVFVVNVQGLTGKKVSYFSYPYSKVQYFGIETAGVFDIDSELILAFSNGARLQFDFKSNVNIREICALISGYIL
ncbi:MAG: PH domain-containing protein [Atopobiaceae bacterium]|nr:PH domain-containing protein [Atopobiaceae bacterium]MBR1829987.1 PH domain-containing protein [Atopobiaceae bacterium]